MNVSFDYFPSMSHCAKFFQKVHKVILRYWTGLKTNWFKSYDTNVKNAKTQKMHKTGKNITEIRSVLQNRKSEIFEGSENGHLSVTNVDW